MIDNDKPKKENVNPLEALAKQIEILNKKIKELEDDVAILQLVNMDSLRKL